MHILLLAATPKEIEPTVSWLRARAETETGNVLHFSSLKIEVLFTGVGQMATAYSLGRRFGAGPLPQLCLQAGIGGALDQNLPLGDVVHITSERLGDLGAEEQDGTHLSLSDIGLFPGIPYDKEEVLRLPENYRPLPFPACAGLTVNRVNGSAASIAATRKRYPDAQVESMEGAAFFHACLLSGLEPVQLRAISNYVEPRNRAAWQIGPAIRNLNSNLQALLNAYLNLPSLEETSP